MADLVLTRIDFRVIHGQVVTRWIKVCGANRIVVANDELAADEFMGDVYKLAAPQGITVDIYSLEDTVAAWNADQFGAGKVLMILKTAADARRLVELGFPLKELQAGNLGGGDGRAETPAGVTFSQQDADDLRAIAEHGVDVYVQMLPDNARVSLEKNLENVKF